MIQKVFFKFSQNYLIKKGWYLVPLPPQKPTQSAFNSVRAFEILKEANKNNPQFLKQPEIAQKQKLIEEIKKHIQQYEKKHSQYQAKYTIPSKKYNYFSLAVSKWFEANKDNKDKSLIAATQNVKQSLQKLTEQDREKLKKQVQQINKKNQQLMIQFKLAVDQYQSLDKFIQKKYGVKIKAIPKEALQKYEEEYKNYKVNQNNKLKQQAVKFNIKEEQLMEYINQHWKTLKEQKKKIKSLQK